MRKWILLTLVLPLLAQADELQYLDHSELALSRLYNDISEATSTIDLSYFIWDPCSSASKVLMKKIAEKTKPRPTAENPNPQKVKVRMLVDAIEYMPRLGPMATYFAENGVDMKFFNPTQNPLMMNTRTHSKITLIDKKVPGKAHLITGGRNLADEYFGLGVKNYVDRDVGVDGPSSSEDKKGTIAQADNGFEKLWNNPDSRKVGLVPKEDMGRMRQCTKWNARDDKLEAYLKANAKKNIEKTARDSCAKVKFTIDDVRHSQSGENLLAQKPTTAAVVDFVKSTKKNLTMENQYFIPDDIYFKELLREKKARGVKIDLYSNMFDGGDELVVNWHWHYMRQENGGGQTNHMNFRVAGLLDKWDFTPPNATYSYHAKTFVGDSANAIVSSFNLDPRSTKINGESALIVKDCPVFAKRMEDITKLTGKVWTQEENLALCQGHRPAPTKVDELLGWLIKDLL